ncbi:MAG: T9SS type A sorting domain-containing protein [Bacteroidetes bacterium]|nr:T9SS type A sorting domain-containing protein [Bacteroidota bacterium]
MKRHCEEGIPHMRESNLLILLLQTISKIDCVVILRLLRQPPCKAALFPRNDVVVLVMVLFSLTSQAAIITVKQDGMGNYTTIQAGINAASTGDTVLVWPGTFFENINYNSKCITVASLYLTTQDESYIQSTIIDGSMADVCIKVINCTSVSTTISGFTVQNGFAIISTHPAGGICIKSSYCKVEKCSIKNNFGQVGGGLYCNNSNVKLSGTIIKENHAVKAGGGLTTVAGSEMEFDTINLNSIFLNYAGQGCDIYKAIPDQPLHVVVDTFTVQYPDQFFIYSIENEGNPINDISISIQHHKIVPVPSDLHINPVSGDNNNSGLSADEPLKNIYTALIRIRPDTNVIRNIFLQNGIYSWLSSAELFEINCRSFVNIIGESVENTIIDGNYKTPMVNFNINTEHVIIKNISIKKGNGKFYAGITPPVYVRGSNHIIFDSIIFERNTSNYYCGFVFENTDNFILKNTTIQENYGQSTLHIYNVSGEAKSFRIENCKYIANSPDSNLIEPGSPTIGIGGDWNMPGLFKGGVVNTLISNNIGIPDPEWGPQCGSGVSLYRYVYTDLINITIGNNIALCDVSSVYNAVDNAIGNIYNSVFFNDEPCEICFMSESMVMPPGTTNITYNDIEGGESGIVNPGNYQNVNWLDGNMDEDPLWEGGEPFSYALQPGSPCINAGVPPYEAGMDYPYIKEEAGNYVLYMLDGDTVTLPATDLAGNPRISGGRIDMGAYEWQDTATIISKFKKQSSKLSVYPNPFTSNVFVSFSTEKEHVVDLQVIDMNGQEIKKIMSGKLPAGNFKLVWDGKDEAGFDIKAGNYLVCLYLDSKLSGYNKMLRM